MEFGNSTKLHQMEKLMATILLNYGMHNQFMINMASHSLIHFVKLFTQHVQNVYVHVQTHLYVLSVELNIQIYTYKAIERTYEMLVRQGEEEYINIQYHSLHFDVCFPKLTKKQKQWNKDSNSKPIDRVRCLMTWVVVRVGHILLACFFTYIDRTVQIAHTLKLASTKRLAPTVAAIWQQIRSSQKLSYVHKIHT